MHSFKETDENRANFTTGVLTNWFLPNNEDDMKYVIFPIHHLPALPQGIPFEPCLVLALGYKLLVLMSHLKLESEPQFTDTC